MNRRRNLVSAALVLALGGTSFAASFEPAQAANDFTNETCQTLNDVTTCDDVFDQALGSGSYESVLGNTYIDNLPVFKDDPSANMAGLEICRIVRPSGLNDFGYVHLTDGVISIEVQPGFHGSATFGYQPCTSDVMGPVTMIKVVVAKMYPIKKAKIVSKHKMKLTNRNPLDAVCNVGKSVAWAHIKAHTSKVVHRSRRWNCWVKQKLGLAQVGSYLGL